VEQRTSVQISVEEEGGGRNRGGVAEFEKEDLGEKMSSRRSVGETLSVGRERKYSQSNGLSASEPAKHVFIIVHLIYSSEEE
jgi:hypothetical protein